jgi:putative tricarboxylic transport membrane protein
MKSDTEKRAGRDWPGLAAAAFCIGLAGYVLWVTEHYTRFGSIFPRTVAIVMIVVGVALIARVIAGLPPTPVTPIQSLWRPLALIGVGVLWVVLIASIGFYPASVVGFICAGLLARFEPWTPRALTGFLVISVSVATIGYVIFAYALNVPFD